MHVFLLDIPRLKFAALIPKGDYVTVCLLGENVDRDLLETFLQAEEVKRCLPADWDWKQPACQCAPRMNVAGVLRPYNDRVVYLGDCGVTRLYKDGIGAAYRAAKAAASTSVFHGVSAEDFKVHYLPACRKMTGDNTIGKFIFAFATLIQGQRFARRAILRMVASEQEHEKSRRLMSTVLWDMFTGSAPYRDILLRTLHPAYIFPLIGHLMVALVTPGSSRKRVQKN